MSKLDNAIQAIRIGNRNEGCKLLEEILQEDPANEDVWLWLSTVVSTDDDRRICLENVLTLNPRNSIASKCLNALHARNFDPAIIMTRSPITEDEGEVESTLSETSLNEFGWDSDTIEANSISEMEMKQHINEIKNLLTKYNLRLQNLQEQKAHAGMDTPIAILIEIEDLETEVENLQTKLAGFAHRIGFSRG